MSFNNRIMMIEKLEGEEQMIAKNNEEERSKLWNIVMSASTIIIILVVVFFIVKIFTANPLEGTWLHDGGNLSIAFKSDQKAEIQWPEKLSDLDITVDMTCHIDKKNKTVQLLFDQASIQAAAEASEGELTDEEIQSAMSSLESTFDYSVDGKELTLTDREYGDQLFLERQ